ncbi:hypothetical protein TAMA11512_13030 [Selenomonas sp. TAMA-11512]|uniref:hypothetical protein n=1 Tax=Selenomonas sp. TAMA-11512 TaxID=3095337 RepID=UPI00308EEA83|nr:hypothetical protein TAMA11512_13030 [Selenomonas sp. TAMA-11512]
MYGSKKGRRFERRLLARKKRREMMKMALLYRENITSCIREACDGDRRSLLRDLVTVGDCIEALQAHKKVQS